ncbi:hypothetical protein ABZ863_12315 [Saccharomonospora sp. NPDC046836]|uniref:hypothetical protein n=1 Tax=Saccharomonospora sp. NPDC046836 TaxID=3156921 RepID=UPI0033E3B94D
MRHNRLRWLPGLFVLLLVAGACTNTPEPRTAPVTATEQVMTNPFTPDDEPAPGLRVVEDTTGTCSPSNVSVGNTAARRCVTPVFLVLDPCFVPPTGQHFVALCLPDPTSTEAVRFTMTADLGPRRQDAGTPQPWFVELADGRMCAQVAGDTLPTLNGEPPTFGCGHADYLYGTPQHGTGIWTMANRRDSELAVETVQIRTAWL